MLDKLEHVFGQLVLLRLRAIAKVSTEHLSLRLDLLNLIEGTGPPGFGGQLFLAAKTKHFLTLQSSQWAMLRISDEILESPT